MTKAEKALQYIMHFINTWMRSRVVKMQNAAGSNIKYANPFRSIKIRLIRLPFSIPTMVEMINQATKPTTNHKNLFLSSSFIFSIIKGNETSSSKNKIIILKLIDPKDNKRPAPKIQQSPIKTQRSTIAALSQK